jgi:protocatechuate 3,4-dioxygenase beta subunit
MNRSKFLSILAMPFLGLLLFSSKNKEKQALLTDCNDPITPPVPEGPFYKNEMLNRIDITENKKGTPIEYIFMVEDKNCKPIEGAIVDIWQCDAEGHYSDFDKEKTLGQTWLRGFQKTDHDGICKFKSIFPGWYDGRITHIHAKVHNNGNTLLTTNLFFKKEIEDKIHQKPLYPKGPNPVPILDDIELKRLDKDNKRHDTLLMDVLSNGKGELTGQYKFAMV